MTARPQDVALATRCSLSRKAAGLIVRQLPPRFTRSTSSASPSSRSMPPAARRGWMVSSALQRAREWLGFKCDGDAMRCMDGNGCECAMAGKLPAPSADEALRALVAEIDAAPCPRVEGMPGTANGYGLMVTSKEIVGQRVRLLTEAPGHGE